MVYPPVRRLAPVQADSHGITILYTYISINLAYYLLFRVKVGGSNVTIGQRYLALLYMYAESRVRWFPLHNSTKSHLNGVSLAGR